jgi:hypothetical protein
MYVQSFIATISEKVRIVNKGGILLFFHSNITLFYLTCVICKRLSLFFWLIFFHYYILELIILVLPSFRSFLSSFVSFFWFEGFAVVRVQFKELIQQFFSLSLFHCVFFLPSDVSVILNFKAFLCVHMT